MEELDPLTELLRGLRLEGADYERCELVAPWSLSFPSQAAAHFHFIAHEGCWLKSEADGWQRLNPGDAVLLPRGTAHVMASAPDLAPVALCTLERERLSEDVCELHGGCTAKRDAAGPVHVLFSGAMRFNLDPLHPLIAMMPELMPAGDLAARDPAVPALLDAMEREVELDRIGACGVLARLADVLAASIIRAWVECGCSDSSGWVAAMRCPKLGKVLAAIHTQPERDWTLAELASLMGASRSSFADKFSRAVGETPARYVARVKMFEARRWIAQDMRVAAAAHRLGYDSEASFSRAFKRIIGHPPSEARAGTRRGD
jgi:AraC-like DNA-binding protein